MKQCPHCGSNQFKALVKRPGAIQFEADGTITILKELADKFSCEVVECLKCKQKVTNDDLKSEVNCTKCGTPTKPEELTEGLCPICHAMQNRPDLANASQEDLIKRLLEMEKQLSTKGAAAVEKKLEASEQTVANVEAKQAETEEEAAAKRSEAARKAAETRKANAAKKAQEEAAPAETAPATPPQPEAPAPAQQEPVAPTNPLDDSGLPDVADDFNLGVVPPTAEFGDDPF